MSYIGRGMYNDRCFAITTSNPIRDIVEIIRWLTREDDTSRSALDSVLDDLASNAKQDNMGRDTVVYWPNIAYIETEHETGEE
jgi:hypothetical protein